MTLIQSAVLGIIEGLTEFLPISSTAHLILASRLFNLETSEYLKSFEISIQLGAIFSVIFLYWKTLIHGWEINKKIVVAFIPTAIIGLIFYRIVKDILLTNYLFSVYSLLIGGALLIVFELFNKDDGAEKLDDITYGKAFAIGFFQSISIIPGVSRAAATIIGGMLLGIRRKTAVEFSFLLAIPTIAAAVGLDLLNSVGSFTKSDFIYLIIGFLVSFISAMASIKLLLRFIQKNNFIPFGVYRIILALSFLFLL